jgi:PTH1 family peptidyl-tRNA hydrolase
VAEPLLVVGLGNPGPRYATTRHNIGYVVADLLAERIGSGFKVHKKSGTDVATGRLAGHPVVLGKPRSYMNESGRQVASLAKFYSVPPAELIVIHDELDIDFGKIRLKQGGGEAGHNGVRSVSTALASKDYLRVRIGIEVPVVCEQAADATELLIKLGLEAAQNQVHAW